MGTVILIRKIWGEFGISTKARCMASGAREVVLCQKHRTFFKVKNSYVGSKPGAIGWVPEVKLLLTTVTMNVPNTPSWSELVADSLPGQRVLHAD
jgi:hypothetical protein